MSDVLPFLIAGAVLLAVAASSGGRSNENTEEPANPPPPADDSGNKPKPPADDSGDKPKPPDDSGDKPKPPPPPPPEVKPEPINNSPPPFIVFSILASGEYTYPLSVEKYDSGLIADPCRSITSAPTVAVEWNSNPWPFVNPYGDITRINHQQFLLTAQAAAQLVNGVSTFIPPSQVKLADYIMASLGSEVKYAAWEPGDAEVLVPGTGEVSAANHDESALAFMELGEGTHWPRGDLRFAVAPRFMWGLDKDNGAYVDIVKSLQGGVNLRNSTFLERGAIKLISARFKDVSCFSLAYAGIMAMKRNFGGEKVPRQQLLNPPIVIAIFDPWSVSFRTWRFKANVVWPYWNLIRITDGPQTFWPDDRDFEVESPTADIFMQVEDDHMYTMPPVDDWQKQGICTPIVFKSGWRNWALTYGWVNDEGPKNRIFDGLITNFLTFRYTKPASAQDPVQICVGWESGQIDGGEWRMCTSEATTNAFEYDGLVPTLLRARSPGLIRLAGGSPTKWALSRRFAFPIPPTNPRITWGWDSLQKWETRRALGEQTISKPDASLTVARVWLFIPEYAAFWAINVRLDKLPKNWCAQRWKAQWSSDVYTDSVVITPFAMQGELKWPAIETVRKEFEASGATVFPDNPEAHFNEEVFKWPGCSIADPVLPSNFWVSIAASNNNFWPLGWFEDVSRINNDFLSRWSEVFRS